MILSTYKSRDGKKENDFKDKQRILMKKQISEEEKFQQKGQHTSSPWIHRKSALLSKFGVKSGVNLISSMVRKFLPDLLLASA